MNAKIAKINSIGKFVGLQYHTVDNVKYIFNVIYRQVSFLVVTLGSFPDACDSTQSRCDAVEVS